MKSERQEQLRELADDLLEQYGRLAGPLLKQAVFELGLLAGVEQELEQWRTLGESSIATHQNILHGKVKLSREAALHIACAQDHDQLKAQAESAITERDAALAKLATYEAAMQRDRAPAWEKQLKDLSVELRSASEYPDISPKYISRENLQMASIKLFEMATVYTHKCNFVPCKLALNQAKLLLENIHASGGIVRLPDFEMIKVVLANITATLQSLGGDRAVSEENQPPTEKQIDLWAEHLQERVRDLTFIVIQIQGGLLAQPTGNKAEQYNNRLRKIISELKELREEIQSW